MPTSIPLRFELDDGTVFIGELVRMDKGSATPTVFDIKEFRNGGVYHAGELIRYRKVEIQSHNNYPKTVGFYWQAFGKLKEKSEALGMLVEDTDWETP